MKTYKSKNFTIEAIQYTLDNYEEVCEYLFRDVKAKRLNYFVSKVYPELEGFVLLWKYNFFLGEISTKEEILHLDDYLCRRQDYYYAVNGKEFDLMFEETEEIPDPPTEPDPDSEEPENP